MKNYKMSRGIRSIFIAAAVLAVVILTAVIMVGCSGSTTKETGYPDLSSGGSESALSPERDEKVVNGVNKITGKEHIPAECPTKLVTDEMYARATNFSKPDLTRLAAVMRRAEAGEAVTIGVIGGSITQGTAASSPDKAYASVMEKWWKETFPQSSVTFVNAGIGGTDSYLGVHRVDEQLLAYKPDFVIVEFSVNDADSSFYKTSYDNLVRRILKQENMPAVMLLFMTQENGTSAVNQHAMVGFNYKLPMLSYKKAVMDEISAGNITWKDISPDNIHPNDKGHAICGELIWRYLGNVYRQLDEIPDEVKELDISPATREVYMNATILDNTEITPDENSGFSNGATEWSIFDKGWSTDKGGSLKFTLEASRIGLLYRKTTDPEWGSAKILIDGTEAMTVNAYDKTTWGSYGTTATLLSEKETGTHTVEIIVPEGESACFDIYGLLVSK